MRGPHIERVEGDVMPVNSYLIHGPTGLVVVDGQLTVSDATKVRRAIDAADVPVAGMVLTHGHPDHYAGAAEMFEGIDAPIVSTADVDRVIRRDDDEKEAIVGPMMGDEWPARRRFPDEVVGDGDTVRLGGVELLVRDCGPGESGADAVWRMGDTAVFAGDLAYNRMHAYLADGHYDDWLAAIDELEADLPDGSVMYVGHGKPGALALLAEQRRYIAAFIEEVAAAATVDADARRERVTKRMRQLVTDDRLLFLTQLSIEPALAVLRADTEATP